MKPWGLMKQNMHLIDAELRDSLQWVPCNKPLHLPIAIVPGNNFFIRQTNRNYSFTVIKMLHFIFYHDVNRNQAKDLNKGEVSLILGRSFCSYFNLIYFIHLNFVSSERREV